MGQGRHTLRSISDPVYHPLCGNVEVFYFSVSYLHHRGPEADDFHNLTVSSMSKDTSWVKFS